MDFEKLYGETSISDGLVILVFVSFLVLFLIKPAYAYLWHCILSRYIITADESTLPSPLSSLRSICESKWTKDLNIAMFYYLAFPG